MTETKNTAAEALKAFDYERYKAVQTDSKA
jgi:hypothetical protein